MTKNQTEIRVVLFANGTVSDYAQLKSLLKDEDVLVAVDGGLKHLLAIECVPHVLLGDLDSVDSDAISRLPSGVEQKRYPSEKDETDLQLALRWVNEQGYRQVLVIGLGGGRLDHMLANFHLLADETWRFSIAFWHKNTQGWIVRSGDSLGLTDKIGATLSLLPLSAKVTAIQTKGLQYPLQRECLEFASPRGVSNVVEHSQAEITIGEGVLLVLLLH